MMKFQPGLDTEALTITTELWLFVAFVRNSGYDVYAEMSLAFYLECWDSILHRTWYKLLSHKSIFLSVTFVLSA